MERNNRKSNRYSWKEFQEMLKSWLISFDRYSEELEVMFRAHCNEGIVRCDV